MKRPRHIATFLIGAMSCAACCMVILTAHNLQNQISYLAP